MHKEARHNDSALEIVLAGLIEGIVTFGVWLLTTVFKFLKAIVVQGWRYRIELLLPLILIGIYAGGYFLRGHIFAGLLVILTVAVAYRLPIRERAVNHLRTRAVQRKWEKTAAEVGAPKFTVRKIEKVAAGELLYLQIQKGTVSDLKKCAPAIHAELQLRDVRITEDRTNGARASMLLMSNDPFHDLDTIRWPNVDALETSIWDPIPIGIDEEGRTVTVSLPEKNILVGGIPGAGKSVCLSLFAATAALDPNCKLWLMDGKQVELAAWAPFAEQFVGQEPNQAGKMLRQVQDIMNKRYDELGGLGEGKKVKRKVEREDGLPVHVVICDELAFYLKTTENPRLRNEIAERFRDIVARGRAAGIILIAATQKADTDTVPGALRDLIKYRLAFQCRTSQASDTILGQGNATDGYDASDIPGSQLGVGYLLEDGSKPLLQKGFWLSDQDIESIAERALARAADDFKSSLDQDGSSDTEAEGEDSE